MVACTVASPTLHSPHAIWGRTPLELHHPSGPSVGRLSRHQAARHENLVEYMYVKVQRLPFLDAIRLCSATISKGVSKYFLIH